MVHITFVHNAIWTVYYVINSGKYKICLIMKLILCEWYGADSNLAMKPCCNRIIKSFESVISNNISNEKEYKVHGVIGRRRVQHVLFFNTDHRTYFSRKMFPISRLSIFWWVFCILYLHLCIFYHLCCMIFSVSLFSSLENLSFFFHIIIALFFPALLSMLY